MANLVAPVVRLKPIEERIIDFRGLNERQVIADGEMQEMWNLTADNYPLLTPRKPRGVLELPSDVKRVLYIIHRFDKVGFIAIDSDDYVSFYYDGVKITEVTGLSVNTKAVAINNKMCFFPEKTCIDITVNGVQTGTYRNLEASINVLVPVPITYESDGKVRLELASNPGFKADDAISIKGDIEVSASGSIAIYPTEVSCIIESVDEAWNAIILPQHTFLEIEGQGTATLTNATIKRTMPDLDYIVEWNNRLWGASNQENTIYASKLGDPSNWEYFQSTGMDSYYAEQGSDEKFTGIAEYSGHLLFFKPNSITRVYGTSPANFQITTTKAYGIEEGSSASALTINDTVYYKSAIGIMAYQGSIPYCISENITSKFKNVVAGTEGTKYYISVIFEEDDSFEGRVLVYDIAQRMWHMEDDFRFLNACKVSNRIYCTVASKDVLMCGDNVMCAKDLMVTTDEVEDSAVIINPEEPTESVDDMEWRAVFGPFDEYIEEHKIYSKLALRLRAKSQASAKVYISLDEGPWELVESYDHISTKGDFIPIIPRRCDRYSVKIEGKGYCEMKSLTRRVRRGSFGRI